MSTETTTATSATHVTARKIINAAEEALKNQSLDLDTAAKLSSIAEFARALGEPAGVIELT
jgi:hypothetical protein